MNQREVIYADVDVVMAESYTFQTILDDDHVEYVKLNHNIQTTNLMAASREQERATSNNDSNMSKD